MGLVKIQDGVTDFDENLVSLLHDFNCVGDQFMEANHTNNSIEIAVDTVIRLKNTTWKTFKVETALIEIDTDDLDTGSTFTAGKDYYVYLCDDGASGVFKISLNSTYPAGYTADSSRKIGGFHTLCVAAGTISGHDLTGYSAGDILPASVWDLKHRPISDPEGMLWVDGIKKWVDIYLSSWNGSKLVSVYNATIADGASTKKFHWYKFTEEFGKIGKRLPLQAEFIAAAKGSPEGTNISGSADPGTTGGNSDTASQRIISNKGLEDMTGVLWQWGEGEGPAGTGGAYANAYDTDAASDNSVVMGQHYDAPVRPRLGGRWDSGVICGSRGSIWSDSPLVLSAGYGARGVAEPKA